MVPAPGLALSTAALRPRGRFLPLARRPRPRLQTPRLSVVVVNYRQWENTAALLRQLVAAPCTRHGTAEIVVIDNHSPTHRLAARLRRWPGVSLRRWGRNRGFARAVNEGCRLSRGEWILLLNPDMTLPDGFLDRVLALADELTVTEPRAGIVGFQLRNSDGSRQLSSGGFPTLLGTLAGLVRPRARRKYRALRVQQRCRVPWVTGCCLLVRRACLQDLGGLDENYFLYYEDVDLCRRAGARRWSVWHDPSLRAVHHYPVHGRGVPPLLRVITRHSLLTYSARHWPRWQARVLAGIVRVEAWAKEIRAWCRQDAQGGELFGALGAIANNMLRGRPRVARRLMNRLLMRHEITY
jgi:N-acetylglucosaminyl-diphospho-decaprenol L-rhamnosyltransferase